MQYWGKSPIMVRFPTLGKCIISYQEVLCSLLKNVNHQADEAVLCNHSINRQLLRISVLAGRLCFGVLWNFCLSLNCDSWVVEGKLFFWICLVISSLLSVTLTLALVHWQNIRSFCFIHTFFSSSCFHLLWEVWRAKYEAPHIRKSVPCELLLLGYIILQMAQRKKWNQPWKNEGSYWGYEEQGNGQLQSIQSFQCTTNDTRVLC